jgi:hypothetical protein
MEPATIAAEVEAAYGDWSGRDLPHLTDLVPLAIGQGIEADADLVFLASVADGHVRCGLICGASLLVGASMRWALVRYCDGDPQQATRFINHLRIQCAEKLATGPLFSTLRAEGDEHWRSFRGERLLTFEEMLARKQSELN